MKIRRNWKVAHKRCWILVPIIGIDAAVTFCFNWTIRFHFNLKIDYEFHHLLIWENDL